MESESAVILKKFVQLAICVMLIGLMALGMHL